MKRNKLIASLLAATLTVSSLPAVSLISSAASGMAGDVNGDGTCTAFDASLLQKWLLAEPGAELNNPQAGDLNNDSVIDAKDLSELKIRLISGVAPGPVDSASSVITFASGSVTISDENGNTVTDHPAIKINGQTVTITQPGEYSVSGKSENGQLIVDVDKNAAQEEKVTLNLTGLTLSHPSVAPLYIANGGDSCVISAKKDTVNTISDGSSHTDSYTTNEGETKQIKAAIFARDDLKIKGKGTLIVNGNTADGIACTDDLKLYNGTITVKAVDDGIRGKDSVIIGDAEDTDFSTLKVNVNAANGDGIKSTNVSDDNKGRVEINGGVVTVDAHSDGIQATREVIINGGETEIHTYQGKDYKASNSGANPGGGWPGGGWPGGGWDDSGHDLGLDFSAKGIKVGDSDAQIGGNITFNGGSVTINSTDDAIHCGETLTVNGGTLKIATADDAIHSDKYLNIKGGKITVTDSYEGIESMQVRITDGDITVYAYDDAINAGEKNAQKTVHVGNDNCILQIDGGTIHAYVTNAAEGDTLDSNGKIVINGGTVYAEGSVNGPDSAMDSDGEMLVNGGILVAVGGLGLGELPVEASQQCSLYWGNKNSNYQKGSIIKLYDSNRKELLSYTSEQALKCAIVSTPEIRTGGRYTLTVNGNTVAEFNVSSRLTKQGDVGSFGFGW